MLIIHAYYIYAYFVINIYMPLYNINERQRRKLIVIIAGRCCKYSGSRGQNYKWF